MCGIAGVFDYNSHGRVPSLLENLRAMPKALHHRGPENLGDWHNQDVYLAQTRLKILDLSSAANQPIFNEDKSIVLVFNGEIYNFQSLRRFLISRGHSFRSSGDSEVIVHLYEEYGENLFSHLDGMFAFSLWDEKRKKLILARDRTGKKPLYYYKTDSLFAFASEIKSFFQVPEIEIEKNDDFFPYYFLYGNIPAPHSFYKNVYSLEPAHYLVLESHGRIQKRRYWDLQKYHIAKNRKIKKKEAMENIRTLINSAVKKRLVSDVPLGAFLSGGIDSSIITAIAANNLSAPLKTFSIGYSGDDQYDETHYARLVARMFGTEHTEFHIKPSMVPFHVDKLIWAHDGPFADFSCLPTGIVSRLAKKKVTVVLTGDGGDEVFGGYNRFLAALWMNRVPKSLSSPMEAILKKTFGCSNNRLVQSLLRALKASNLSHLQRLTCWTSCFYSDLENLINSDFYGGKKIDKDFHYRSFLSDIEKMTPLSQMLYINLKTYLHDDLNIKVDRASMTYSLEARAPFLDHHLIEYCATLPDHFLIRRTIKKYILKEAYKDLLPKTILHRRKVGFGLPLSKWFRNELKEYIHDELLSLNKAAYYINSDYVQSLLSLHMQGHDYSLKLWSVLMFKKWMNKKSAQWGIS